MKHLRTFEELNEGKKKNKKKYSVKIPAKTISFDLVKTKKSKSPRQESIGMDFA
jgi:hypothetical protein